MGRPYFFTFTKLSSGYTALLYSILYTHTHNNNYKIRFNIGKPQKLKSIDILFSLSPVGSVAEELADDGGRSVESDDVLSSRGFGSHLKQKTKGSVDFENLYLCSVWKRIGFVSVD